MNTTVTRKPSVEKPWLQFFSEEAKKSTIPEKTIYQVVKNTADKHPSVTAMNYFDNKIRYGKMLENINDAAASLEALGVKKGDVIACISATVPEMAYSIYAANKLGATTFTIDPRMTPEFVEERILGSKAEVVLVLDLAYDHLKSAFKDSSIKKVIVFSVDTSMPFILRTLKQFKMPSPKIPYEGKTISWKAFMALGKGKSSYTADYGENDVAAITLTGGTTGAPKGVMITNYGFNAIMMSFYHCGVPYGPGDKFMNIIPAFASYGIVASLHMPFGLGLENIVFPKFDADTVGHQIKKYKPAHTLMIPAHYEKLINSKEMVGFDLSFFKTAGSGGDTMNEGLETKLNNFLKDHGCDYKLSQGYGMSEVSSAASCCCNGNFRSQSVGYPLLNTTISIFDPETHEELTYNQEGEICITGPAVMAGYFNNPEETEKIMIKHEDDGLVWVHSGDIGYMDEDGYIYIKGRIKRMITKFDGHKVFPVFIESILSKYHDIESCAVVGIKDRTRAQGQIPLAVIKLVDGVDEATARKTLEEIIKNDIEERGRPEAIQFIDEMPRTGMGKIDYKKLGDDYDAKLDAEGK